jgi:hypothetical protein
VWILEQAGIESDALWRYVEEQIYSLPDAPREALSIVLIGSRAAGAYSDGSDVDLAALCPQAVYEAMLRAAREAGVARAEHSFFHVPRDGDPKRYFGAERGNPHFSLIPIEAVERQFRDYDDVPLWLWTNAKILTDPGDQLRRVVEGFAGYPREVLVRKIKYRWLLAGYWEIDVTPHHPSCDEELLPAATAMVNAVNELLRVFFLVEGKPFPYPSKLMRLAAQTALGREFLPMLQRVVDLVVGRGCAELDPWERLDRAFTMLAMSSDPHCRRLERACGRAMIAAGVDPAWVAADYDNIDELLLGRLGPVP